MAGGTPSLTSKMAYSSTVHKGAGRKHKGRAKGVAVTTVHPVGRSRRKAPADIGRPKIARGIKAKGKTNQINAKMNPTSSVHTAARPKTVPIKSKIGGVLSGQPSARRLGKVGGRPPGLSKG